ncbi:hypothetical protein GIB67_009098 [Kingdonia uniflora]|uniref:Uncharacterized protein n=1 Tax=Kingdonia uniflora TaxID=39325 RepID=A0A7J7N3F5_9MAGN|nr:hypothetical protein GIB67_009098 [Kingdonia uniflora]
MPKAKVTQHSNFSDLISLQVLRLVRYSVRIKRSILVQWTLPPPGLYKLNTNDSALTSGMRGAGGIIRNHNEDMLLGYSIALGNGTNTVTEMYVVLHVLLYCKQQGWFPLIVEVMSSASLTGGTSSMGLQTINGTPMPMHMSNMISNGAAQNLLSSGQSGIASLVGTSQSEQNSVLGLFSTQASNISGNSSHGMSAPLVNVQAAITTGQSVPAMSQGNLSGTQIGTNMNQNIMNGSSGISSGAGTMMPTSGIS